MLAEGGKRPRDGEKRIARQGDMRRPRERRHRADMRLEKTRSGDPVGQGGLADQAGHGGEVEPEVGLEDGGGGSRQAVDGGPFEIPGLEGGVASLHGVTCTVVEAFPGRGADREITYQAGVAIGKA